MCTKVNIMFKRFVLFVCCSCFGTIAYTTKGSRCTISIRIESGWVCGLIREAELGVQYASFRGVPYGKQPLRKLRFQELQPVKPWHNHYDATEEGPICPQNDRLYHGLVKPIKGMSEACIYVNVHVPATALLKEQRSDEHFHRGYFNKTDGIGYPIFVFIHGGGFYSGSGNADLHGPEYLISKGVIVITFNYRLNVFGFLSLNTRKIPGNTGLRDQLTLLRWVQRNAAAFGGDPRDVTLAGQSTGATCAHLLALSKEAKGLFKRVILMSGTAITSFYTSSPVNAQINAANFIKTLGINSTDPDYIHNELINMSIERIMTADYLYEHEAGLVPFSPVVESEFPGITRIVDDDPIRLIQNGRDKDYPMVIGFTNNECEFFRELLIYLQILRRIEANPALILPAGIAFTASPNVTLHLAHQVIEKYFSGKLKYDEYVTCCSDTLFTYPAFQLVAWREQIHAAPSYLYKFAYEADYSPVKDVLGLQYEGSTHVEDLTYIFRENAVLGDDETFPPRNRDDYMKDWMAKFIVNFIRHDDPTCGVGWPPVESDCQNYQLLNWPGLYQLKCPTKEEMEMIHFHDKINQIGRNMATNDVRAERHDSEMSARTNTSRRVDSTTTNITHPPPTEYN